MQVSSVSSLKEVIRRILRRDDCQLEQRWTPWILRNPLRVFRGVNNRMPAGITVTRLVQPDGGWRYSRCFIVIPMLAWPGPCSEETSSRNCGTFHRMTAVCRCAGGTVVIVGASRTSRPHWARSLSTSSFDGGLDVTRELPHPVVFDAAILNVRFETLHQVEPADLESWISC
jgi:hypothetical protein